MEKNPEKTGKFVGRDIAFDVGNVILDFDFSAAVAKLGPRSTAPMKDIIRYFSATRLADLFERGRMKPKDFFESASRDLGLKTGYDEFVRLWNDIFTPTEGMDDLVSRLSTRFRLHAASNTNVLHKQHFLSEFPVFRRFRNIVASCDLGLRKPDVEFYGKLVEIIGAPAAEILFIDDLESNVKGAADAGLMALRFTCCDGLVRDLKALGIDA